MPTLVGIDHGFSFPLRYFEHHHLPPDRDEFLDDFQRHWPFDDWDITAGHSALAEVYPALWKHAYAPEDRTPDQHDAYTVAT